MKANRLDVIFFSAVTAIFSCASIAAGNPEAPVREGSSLQSHPFVALTANVGQNSNSLNSPEEGLTDPVVLESFQLLDANRDGWIQRSEITSEFHDMKALFSQYDQDSNGKLSLREYRLSVPRNLAPMTQLVKN